MGEWNCQSSIKWYDSGDVVNLLKKYTIYINA